MSHRLFGALAASAITLAFPAAAHHPSASSAGTAGPITTISATTLDPGQSVVSFLVHRLFSSARVMRPM